MSSVKNMQKNISPKARMMLIFTVISVVGVVAVSIHRISGSDKVATGGASLSTAPTASNISKDRPTDQILFDETTEVGQLYKNAEVKRSEVAIEKGKSHVDSIRMPSEQEKAAPQREVLPQKPSGEPVQARLSALMGERQRLEKEQAEKEQRKQQVSQSSKGAENPWASFIESEKSAFGYVHSSSPGILSEFVSADAKIPTPEIFTGKSAVAANTQNQAAASRNPYLSNTHQEEDAEALRRTIARNQAGQPNLAGFQHSDDHPADYPSDRLSQTIRQGDIVTGDILTGDTFMAVLQIGVNTDEPSEVKATIVEKGPLEGAVLVGTPTRVGEKAHIAFNTMSLKRKGFGVSAVALDPETKRSLVADSVDRHTITRWGGLALASFVDGYADSLSSTQTVTNTDGSSSTTRDAVPNSSDQTKIAIGKVGENMVPLMESQFNRPPTVTVDPNRIIYIMFTNNVDLSKDD